MSLFNQLNHVTGGDTFEGLLQIASIKDAMKGIFDAGDTEGMIKALSKAGLSGKNLQKVLVECGMSTEVAANAVKKFGKSGVPLVTKLKDGFKGLASTVGLTTKQLGALGIAGLAIGAITAAVKAYNSWLQKCVDNAKAAAETWSAQNDTLEGQVSRIEELNKKLKEGNLTEQEAYDIKSELYSIQNDLVGTYGDQAAGIDLVNGKLDTEIQKVKDLAAAWAEEFYRENLVGGSEAQSKMNMERGIKITPTLNVESGAGSDIVRDILKKYPELFTRKKKH